jgi:hypothetical protein
MEKSKVYKVKGVIYSYVRAKNAKEAKILGAKELTNKLQKYHFSRLSELLDIKVKAEKNSDKKLYFS